MHSRKVVSICLVVLVGAFAVACAPLETTKATTAAPAPAAQAKTVTPGGPDTSKFGWERDCMAFVPQDWVDSQAITSVAQTTSRAYLGSGCVEMTCDLIGGDANKSKGEIYVDIRHNPPEGVEAPVNLEGKEVSCWLYCPKGAAGEKSRPNGIQLFVKDENWGSLYGSWKNIVPNTWFKASIVPATTTPPGGWKSPDFDPTKIIQVGIKVSTGGGSKATYSGVIFADAMDW